MQCCHIDQECSFDKYYNMLPVITMDPGACPLKTSCQYSRIQYEQRQSIDLVRPLLGGLIGIRQFGSNTVFVWSPMACFMNILKVCTDEILDMLMYLSL